MDGAHLCDRPSASRERIAGPARYALVIALERMEIELCTSLHCTLVFAFSFSASCWPLFSWERRITIEKGFGPKLICHLVQALRKGAIATHKQRINGMTSITMGLEKTEHEIFAFEVADEALEIAAGTAKEKVNFALGACTGLSECPG